MNTPIIKISDNQNEITHESGVVTVFDESENSCDECCYGNGIFCENIKAACMKSMRNDGKFGIFKLKP